MEHEAKHQDVSLNNLANYFLTTQLSQVEALSMIDERISKKIFLDLNPKLEKYLMLFQIKKKFQIGMPLGRSKVG